MAWSLDWFGAAAIARAGGHVRRVAWTDKWLVFFNGLWWIVTADDSRLVKATDFGEDEFYARDWTDQPFNADICAATPAYNTTPPAYGQWTDEPIFTPPPIPGFPSDDA